MTFMFETLRMLVLMPQRYSFVYEGDSLHFVYSKKFTENSSGMQLRVDKSDT